MTNRDKQLFPNQWPIPHIHEPERWTPLYTLRRRIIACTTVIEEMSPFLPADVPSETLDFGLHLHPQELRKFLQKQIDQFSHQADVWIVFQINKSLNKCISIHFYINYLQTFSASQSQADLSCGVQIWYTGKNFIGERRRQRRRRREFFAVFICIPQ